MNTKTQKIINWALTAVVAFIFLGSAYGKLMPSEANLGMAKNFGLNQQTFFYIGLVELLSIILFIIPRTGIIGTLLLAAYMGGAIATHLEHNESIIFPCVIQAFIWIVAFIRFPELRQRIVNNNEQ